MMHVIILYSFALFLTGTAKVEAIARSLARKNRGARGWLVVRKTQQSVCIQKLRVRARALRDALSFGPGALSRGDSGSAVVRQSIQNG